MHTEKMTPTRDEKILIASWLEPELVKKIETAAPGVRVIYEPDLLRPPRYPADHTGLSVDRSEAQESKWLDLLGQATILFDFDQTHLDDLPDVAPKVRWLQATSAGIGQLVRRLRYAERMPATIFTTARGVHARPLSEFAVLAMLMHTRRLLHTVRAQGDRSWERFAGTDLEGRVVLIIGLGAIGEEVARVCKSFGMKVLGVRRRPEKTSPHVHELHGIASLPDLLGKAEYSVLATPHTDRTDGMIGRRELAAMRPGAVLINIGRGALVDEPALVEALKSGHLGGAFLDVFAEEPLPAESPLWEMPSVLISPHSASTSDRENERIVDLFCENLTRYLQGEPLLNVLDTQELY